MNCFVVAVIVSDHMCLVDEDKDITTILYQNLSASSSLRYTKWHEPERQKIDAGLRAVSSFLLAVRFLGRYPLFA